LILITITLQTGQQWQEQNISAENILETYLVGISASFKDLALWTSPV